MNRYLRLLMLLAQLPRMSKIGFLEESTVEFRVLPNDLSPAIAHMNNARYLAMSDLALFAHQVRSGCWKYMRRDKLISFVAAASIQYRREIDAMQKYSIRTRVVGWDERFFYIEYVFLAGTTVCAVAMDKTMLKGRERVAPITMLQQLGIQAESIRLTDTIRSWNTSLAQQWQETKEHPL